MRKTLLAILATAALATAALAAGAPAEAAIVNFSVSGSGTGTFSIDTGLNSLTAANLNFGGTTFTTANTGLLPQGGTTFLLGGTLNGVNTVVFNTNDFFFLFNSSSSLQTVGLTYDTGGSILEGQVTLTQVAAPTVPEASTWAMMLLGFAGMGFAMRRRRRMLAAA